MERQDQIIAEITALKMLLRDTDYEVTKYAEGLTACTTQKEIQAYRAEFMAEHGEVIENRKAWRAKINELEEELDNLPPVDPVAEAAPIDAEPDTGTDAEPDTEPETGTEPDTEPETGTEPDTDTGTGTEEPAETDNP